MVGAAHYGKEKWGCGATPVAFGLALRDVTNPAIAHRRFGSALLLRDACQSADDGFAVAIDDDFLHYLFQVLEGVSGDVNDPYHLPVIRSLVRTCDAPGEVYCADRYS